jgi:hypothetical protein
MREDLSNLNDLMAEIEETAIRTSQGSFVKLDDVRRLMEKRTKAREDEQLLPQPKTLEEARAAVKRDPEVMKHFPAALPQAGSAVPANEPQSASRP